MKKKIFITICTIVPVAAVAAFFRHYHRKYSAQ